MRVVEAAVLSPLCYESVPLGRAHVDEAELGEHLVAGVAAVEADVVARDGLVAPCVVGRLKFLAAVLVHDGDDAAQMVGEEIEHAVGAAGLLLVQDISVEVI